jgi:hypothetical protein
MVADLRAALRLEPAQAFVVKGRNVGAALWE